MCGRSNRGQVAQRAYKIKTEQLNVFYYQLCFLAYFTEEFFCLGKLLENLVEEGYNCITAPTGEDALRRLSRSSFDMVLLDLKLPGISGMDVLKEVKSNCPESAVIVVTAAGDAQTAVEAMKIGAVDYITKPFELERINSSIEAALQELPVMGKESAPARDSPEASDNEVDWTAHLDAVARGVELRLGSLIAEATTRTIVEETVNVARNLDISEDQIEKWAAARLKQNVERIEVMNSLLKKLERNPIAQIVLGMNDRYQYPPGHESRLN